MSNDENAKKIAEDIIRQKKLGGDLPKATAMAIQVSGNGKESGLIDLTKLAESTSGSTVIIDCRDMSVVNVFNVAAPPPPRAKTSSGA